mmetsp:Transcript_1569/g.3347  ORF Transcript_1569/g.3347 Transcript_1569/m.3347 type:complete len:110 (+) Transcript_1569:153-482(+)
MEKNTRRLHFFPDDDLRKHSTVNISLHPSQSVLSTKLDPTTTSQLNEVSNASRPPFDPPALCHAGRQCICRTWSQPAFGPTTTATRLPSVVPRTTDSRKGSSEDRRCCR